MGALERFSLSGRVAVVTGGTRGLGAGFAAALGDAGASVVLVGRDEDAAEGVLKSLRDNDSLRRHVATQLAGVQATLDGLLVDRPRRRLVRNQSVQGGP